MPPLLPFTFLLLPFSLCVNGLLIVLWSLPAVCQTAPTSKWQKIDADGLFSFRLPQGFARTNMVRVEHYLGEYYKGRTRRNGSSISIKFSKEES